MNYIHLQWRLTILLELFCVVNAYNIDLYDVPLSFKGPAGSYLGFSLAVHTIPGTSWLVVGAPRANSTAEPRLVSPGAIYMCPLNTLSDPACSQIVLDTTGNTFIRNEYADIKDNQFLGVSVDARAGSPSRMMACGHLWRNDFQKVFNDSIYDSWTPNGICYLHEGHLQGGRTKTIRFTDYANRIYSNNSLKVDYVYGFSLSGMAVHVAKDNNIYIGRPGLPQRHYDATGGVDLYVTATSRLFSVSDISHTVPENSNLGYAITTGNVLSDTKDSYSLVAGAPNTNLEGQVIIYKMDVQNSLLLRRLNSTQYKSGFGSALLAVDVNGDGWDDLFIGAPLYTTNVGDIGLVHVYYGTQGDLIEGPKLKNNQQFSRFGTAISSAGDLDGDGYNDIVVGAPYENDNRGAVYVFNGSPNGVSINYTQRISANELPEQPRGLGYGMVGAFDIDGNGYDDLGVGAYESDQVFVVRSRPVITISTTIALQDTCIKLNEHVCVLSSGNSVPCFAVSFKFSWNSYQPNALARIHAINWDTSMDDYEALTHRARLINHGNATREGRGREVLNRDQETEQTIIIQVPRSPADKIRPIRLTTRYSLDNNTAALRRDNPNGLAPIINQTQSGVMFTEIHFCKECRDLICRTDLAVDMKANATTYVIGQQKLVLFQIDILNGEDGAYNSRLDFIFTPGITVSPYRSQSCFKEMNDEETDSEVFSCETGNPMLPNSSQTILFVLCCSEKLAPNDLRFTAVVSTRSTETEEELKNNNVTVIIPAVHEARLLAKGLSNPEELVAIQMAESGTSSQRAKHVLDIRNEGPGFAPYFTVRIHPTVDRSDIAFTVSDFQVSQGSRGINLVSCRKNGNVNVNQTGAMQSQKVFPQPRNVKLVVGDYMECEVRNLAVDETVTITYNVDLQVSADGTSSAGFSFVSDVKLPRFIGREDCGLCQNIQIKTTILPPSAEQSLPLWVILVSIFAGLLLLIILIIVLVKVGFFRRNRHEGVVAKRQSKARAKSFMVPEDEMEAVKELQNSNPQTPLQEKAAMEQYVSAVMKKT